MPEQFLKVLFEIPFGKGKACVCDLDLEESGTIDPAAQLFALNMLRAAADPNSTRSLPSVPFHRKQLVGRKGPHR